MLEYVKICPKCGHANPDGEEVCGASGCGEFLGFVSAVPAAGDVDKPQKDSAETIAHVAPLDQGTPAHSVDPRQKHQSHPVTMRYAEPVFYLELMGTAQIYEVRNRWIIGQAHPTSQANIQLSGLPGANFIHREHCSFEYDNGQWFVTAIKRQSFTNPTYVNQQRLEPGQRYAIKNGDRLILAQVTLAVRIVES